MLFGTCVRIRPRSLKFLYPSRYGIERIQSQGTGPSKGETTSPTHSHVQTAELSVFVGDILSSPYFFPDTAQLVSIHHYCDYLVIGGLTGRNSSLRST